MQVSRWLAVVLFLTLLTVRASAHGGHDGGFGHDEPSGGSSEGGLFGHKPSESPDAVRMDVAELEQQKEEAEQRHAKPGELAALDKKLAVARVRLQIAEKRKARDEAKQGGDASAAGRLDREVGALKKKLRQLEAR